MSFEEITKSAWETIQVSFEHVANGFNAFLAFLAKIIPLYLLLGVVIAHLEQLISKKQSMTSVFISFVGASICLYVLSPILESYLSGSHWYSPICFAVGYFIHHIIKFITNERRINAWLLHIEKFAIEWLKNKFTKK